MAALKTLSVIETARKRDDLWISMISLWEVAKKIEKGQLVLDRPVDQWLDAATAVEGLHLFELSRAVLVEICRLPPRFHGDRADQMLVATARHHGAVLVSKDERILKYEHVTASW